MANAVGFVDFKRRGELHLCMAFLQWSFNVVKFPEDLNRDGKMVRVMLTSTHRRWMIVLVLILVSATAQMVSANPDSQSWHLLNEAYTGKIADDGTCRHHWDCFMNKTGNATSERLQLPHTKTAWWYAEYPAQFDGVTFGEGNWIVNISNGPTKSCTIWANVCKVNDSTGEVTYLANGSVSNLPDNQRVTNIICYDVGETNQVFTANERLALRIYHNKTSALWIYYYDATDGKYSNLTSPASDPGYPVPELPTLALFSVGLLIIAGCAYMGRRAE